jgi:hypothetical protein
MITIKIVESDENKRRRFPKPEDFGIFQTSIPLSAMNESLEILDQIA